ncbi:MAG: helix-turn-helix domain-containing protein, partial [Bacillota bacterium]|nr:helix-turn-helix domain-containing protein [Bacillota bacterium]
MNTIEKGFKYRIYLNKSQQMQVELFFNAKRFVWNYFLKLNMDRFQNKQKILSYNQMSTLLTQFKKDNPWLKQCEKSVLQNTLKDLSIAYTKFFKGSMKYTDKTLQKAKRTGKHLTFYDLDKHPKFKSYKNNYQSCKINFTNNNIRVEEKEIKYTSTGKYRKQFCKIKLPKIKQVKIAYSRQYQGRIVSSTLSRDTDDKYYISLCCIDIP